VRLVLASSSPRRHDLLARIGAVPDQIVAPEVDETPLAGELPRAYALRIAAAKARAVAREPDDEAGLRRMLGLLSGRRHHCLSAVCLVDGEGRERMRLSDTIVGFKRLTPAEIDWYVASGEGMGKAGGYAIQGRAEAFVRYLAGSHSGVVGLPLFETRALLASAGYRFG
jgi:septum formation protein